MRRGFVSQATFTEAGAALVDVAAEQVGASARFADGVGHHQNGSILDLRSTYFLL